VISTNSQVQVNEMMSEKANWTSVAFCAFLCALALVLSIAGLFNEALGRSGQVVFLAFLPMCFVYVALVTANMRRQILALTERVEQLQRGPASGE